MTGDETGEDTTGDGSADVWELADRLFDAIERGDVDGVRSIYADHVTVWHNDDDAVQDREANLRVLERFIAATSSRTYDEIRRTRLDDDRVVQQHVLRLRFADGRTAALPACLFVTARAGRIVRIEEYLDAASVARAFRPS